MKSKLELASRREAIGAMATLVLTPKVAGAFSQQLDENIVEQSQQSTGGKLDLNAAFVVSSVFRKISSPWFRVCRILDKQSHILSFFKADYKQYRGMFPHAAGKIASNGPYKTVRKFVLSKEVFGWNLT